MNLENQNKLEKVTALINGGNHKLAGELLLQEEDLLLELSFDELLMLLRNTYGNSHNSKFKVSRDLTTKENKNILLNVSTRRAGDFPGTTALINARITGTIVFNFITDGLELFSYNRQSKIQLSQKLIDLCLL